MRAATGSNLNEEWINNCVESDKLKEAIVLIKSDSSKSKLLSIAEKRLKLLVIGPSEAEKKEAENLRLKGNELVKVGNYLKARDYYTRSIAINPTEAGTFGNRALTHQKTNNIKEAIEDAKRTIILNKSFARGYQRLAEGYMLDKKYLRAYAALKALLKKDPGNKSGNNLMAEVRRAILENGIVVRDEDAEKEATDLLARKFRDDSDGFENMEDIKPPPDPSNTSEIEKFFAPCNKLRKEAKTLHQRGNFDEALDLYKRSFKILEKLKQNSGPIPKEEFGRREAILNNNIAVCYKHKQESGEVIAYTTKVIEDKAATNEILLKAYILRAFAYESIDKLKKAKDDWVKVKELQPGNLDAAKGLSRIASALQEDEAQKFLDSVGEAVRGLEEYKKRGNELYKASSFINNT